MQKAGFRYSLVVVHTVVVHTGVALMQNAVTLINVVSINPSRPYVALNAVTSTLPVLPVFAIELNHVLSSFDARDEVGVIVGVLHRNRANVLRLRDSLRGLKVQVLAALCARV